MSKAPGYKSQVNRSIGNTDRKNIQSTPQQFGFHDADNLVEITKAMPGLIKAVDNIYEEADLTERENNYYDIMRLSVSTERATNKGKLASGHYSKVLQSSEKAFSEATKGLSPRKAEKVRRAIQNQRNSLLNQELRYQTQSALAYKQTQDNRKTLSSMKLVGNAEATPVQAATEIAAYTERVTKTRMALGEEGDNLKKNIVAELGKFAAGSVTEASQVDAKSALIVLDRVKGMFAPADYDELKNKYEKVAVEEAGTAAGLSIVASGLSVEKEQAEVKKLPEGERSFANKAIVGARNAKKAMLNKVSDEQYQAGYKNAYSDGAIGAEFRYKIGKPPYGKFRVSPDAHHRLLAIYNAQKAAKDKADSALTSEDIVAMGGYYREIMTIATTDRDGVNALVKRINESDLPDKTKATLITAAYKKKDSTQLRLESFVKFKETDTFKGEPLKFNAYTATFLRILQTYGADSITTNIMEKASKQAVAEVLLNGGGKEERATAEREGKTIKSYVEHGADLPPATKPHKVTRNGKVVYGQLATDVDGADGFTYTVFYEGTGNKIDKARTYIIGKKVKNVDMKKYTAAGSW